MTLGKEAILSANDRTVEVVAVPEWGGDVTVKTMSGTERDAFEQSIVQGKDKMDLANVRARLCVRCIVGDDGERVFGDGDAIALGAKSAAALDRVFGAAQKLNGLSADDVEELAGNSEAAPSGDSTSG